MKIDMTAYEGTLQKKIDDYQKESFEHFVSVLMGKQPKRDPQYFDNTKDEMVNILEKCIKPSYEDLGQYWALNHPELGYLTFGSYNKVTVHDKPNPRSFFTKESQFQDRLKNPFWVKGKRYKGSDIIAQQISIQWAPA